MAVMWLSTTPLLLSGCLVEVKKQFFCDLFSTINRLAWKACICSHLWGGCCSLGSLYGGRGPRVPGLRPTQSTAIPTQPAQASEAGTGAVPQHGGKGQ